MANDLPPGQAVALAQTMYAGATEMVRLLGLSDEYPTEKLEMKELQTGLRKCLNAGRVAVGAVWAHTRLAGSTEEALQVDISKNEIGDVRKLLGHPKGGWAAAPFQPISVAPAFQESWQGGFPAPPLQPMFAPPVQPMLAGSSGGNHSFGGGGGKGHGGGRGHGGARRGRGRGDGRGTRPAVCAKCMTLGQPAPFASGLPAYSVFQLSAEGASEERFPDPLVSALRFCSGVLMLSAASFAGFPSTP